MRLTSTALLAALAAVLGARALFVAVPVRTKTITAAPFCAPDSAEHRKHVRHRGHRNHAEHRSHHEHGATHAGHTHVHAPPPAIARVQPPVSPSATLTLDAFDAPSPLSVAEAEKAARGIHR